MTMPAPSLNPLAPNVQTAERHADRAADASEPGAFAQVLGRATEAQRAPGDAARTRGDQPRSQPAQRDDAAAAAASTATHGAVANATGHAAADSQATDPATDAASDAAIDAATTGGVGVPAADVMTRLLVQAERTARQPGSGLQGTGQADAGAALQTHVSADEGGDTLARPAIAWPQGTGVGGAARPAAPRGGPSAATASANALDTAARTAEAALRPTDATAFASHLDAATARHDPVPAATGHTAHGAMSALAGLTGASALSTASGAGPAMPAAPVEVSIPVRPDQAGFASALGTQITLLARDGVGEARLHLNPAELGPVWVQISVTGQTARVDLAAEQALTRQALEQSMPSLASALRDSGLTLTGGGVFEQPGQPGSGDDQEASGRRGAGHAGTAADTAGADAPPAPRTLRGMVDVFA